MTIKGDTAVKNSINQKPQSRKAKVTSRSVKKQESNIQYPKSDRHPVLYQKTSKISPSPSQNIDDKYDLELQKTNKNKVRISKANHDPTYQQWAHQNPDRFGFIPLGPLLLPSMDKGLCLGSDPVELYNAVKNQEQYNFCSSQVTVPSQLKYQEWQSRLQGYWDQLHLYLIKYCNILTYISSINTWASGDSPLAQVLIELIYVRILQYGFPLDFDKNSPLESNNKNHHSGLAFPKDIDAYINEEIAFGAFDLLKNTLETLGFDISLKKLVQPCTKVTCLGVEVDTENFTVAVPQEKLSKIMDLCNKWIF